MGKHKSFQCEYNLTLKNKNLVRIKQCVVFKVSIFICLIKLLMPSIQLV